VLSYQPHAPPHDPIARDLNVQIDSTIRNSLSRATFDTPRQRAFVTPALGGTFPAHDTDPQVIGAAISDCALASAESAIPQHVTLEITTNRMSTGLFARSLGCPVNREDLSIDAAKQVFQQLASAGDVALTLHGAGDPLLHPHFDDIILLAKSSGIVGVHVRTELLADRTTLDRILACGVDVITIDLNADRAATYQAMMGFDRFKDVLLNIEYLLERRHRLTRQPGTAALALPWVVPHLQRRLETYEDIESFFDRWQAMLGTAVIHDPQATVDGQSSLFGLTPAITPHRNLQRERARTMTIRSDGSVPLDLHNFNGTVSVGNIAAMGIQQLWRNLLMLRFPADAA
jgi:hypothetical protein